MHLHVLFRRSICELCVLFPVVLFLMGCTEKPSAQVVTVDYKDIPKRVKIIGKLGYPLTTIVSVRGTWVDGPVGPKPRAPFFVVTHINGKAMNSPAEFDFVETAGIEGDKDFEERVAGEQWEIHGWETGGFVGLPTEILQLGRVRMGGVVQLGEPSKLLVDTSAPPFNSDVGASGFLTKLCYFKTKKISSSLKETNEKPSENVPNKMKSSEKEVTDQGGGMFD